MSFLDEMKDELLSAGREVSQKAKEVSGIAKLKLDIRSKQDALDKQYIALGKMYYDMEKEGEMPEAEITAISTLLNEIADLKSELLRMQGATTCPACGETLPEGISYCSKCGAKLR